MASGADQRSVEDVIWAAREVLSGSGDAVSVQNALIGLEEHEHASESAWPYGSPHWSTGRPEAARESSNRSALPPWERLALPRFDLIRDELTNGSAVILTVGVVLNPWQEPEPMIDAPPGEKIPGKHAVLVVGATEKEDSVEALKIKNSWGPNWGQGGYALMSRDYLDAYGICAHKIEAIK